MKKSHFFPGLFCGRLGRLFLVFIVALVLSWDFSSAKAFDWEVGPIPFPQEFKNISLSFGPSGYPHVLYTSNLEDIYYAYFDGNKWNVYPEAINQIVESSTEIKKHKLSRYALAIDSDGNPHLAYIYVDNNSTSKLVYAYYDGSQWHSEVIADNLCDYSSFSDNILSIALDSNDNPHIAYFNCNKDERIPQLKYAYRSGANWVKEVVYQGESLDEEHYEEISLALDSQNKPGIAFKFIDTSSPFNRYYDLKYAYKQNGAWQIDSVDNGTENKENVSLSFDSQDQPHIGYLVSQDLKHTYWDKTQGSWSTETVESGNISFASLWVDLNDHLHAAYAYKDGLDNLLKYAYCDALFCNGAWNIETVANLGYYGGARDVILGLDFSNSPHVVYFEIEKTVLAHLSKAEAGWNTPEIIDVAALPGESRQPFMKLDSQEHPHIVFNYKYNDLRYAFWNGSRWIIKIVDNEDGRHPVLAIDHQDHPWIVYKNRSLTIKYAHWNGNQWIKGIMDDTNVGWPSVNERDLALAVDNTGRPHVAYIKVDEDSYVLAYAEFSYEGWLVTLIPGTNGAALPSLALDRQNRPHIAFKDYDDGLIKYAWQNGDNWEIEIPDNPDDPAVWFHYASLAIDSSDNVHLAYCDAYNRHLKYAYRTDNNWTIETVDTAGCGQPFLALNSDNLPLIIYKSSFARLIGGEWNIERIGYEIAWPTLDVDAQDGIHIVFYNEYNNYLSYVYRSPITSYTLTLTLTGDGAVISDPAGLNCPETCSASFVEGTQVTLTAMAGENFVFTGWKGDCAGCEGTTCTIAMDADKTCSAEFEEVPNEPPVIESLEADPTSGLAPLTVTFTCQAYDSDGEIVEYQWDLDGDNEFEEVTDSNSITHTYETPGLYETRCKVLDDDEEEAISEPKVITVQAPPALYTLTIAPVPEHGSVLVPEEGGQISCGLAGGDCAESYEEETEVTLYAEPDEGYQFAGWTGDCAGCEGTTCTIVMDADKTCSAIFEEEMAGPLPDLVVKRILTPRYWRAGRFTIVTVLIENRGEADVTVPFDVHLYLNPFLPLIDLGTRTVDGLAAGKRKLVRFRIRVPEEACYDTIHHTLHAVVDSGWVIPESNEENNEAMKNITIRSCPTGY